jgi:Tol biopolymer transport system component
VIKKIIAVLAICCLINLVRPAQAQLVEYNHTELKWNTIETENFYVHFHPGADRTAKLVAKIAEDVHGSLAKFYDYVADTKIHWIIRDHEDYSNGATYYYDNKIEIWATSMDFELRGTHDWLRNVITHEYTHLINLGAARKMTRVVPALYFQLMDYEDEKREDVLFGFPNKIVSYPFSQTIVPHWFAEGTAQFQIPGLNYENWDSHRDMILRTAIVQDYLLTLNQMGVFEKNSVGSEMVYNQGFSLVLYINRHYGVKAIADLNAAQSRLTHLTFNGAAKKVLKISEDRLYHDWKNTLKKLYDQRLYTIQQNIVQGEVIHELGTSNFYPQWAPDGKSVAFITNKGRDYLSQTSLVIYNFETREVKMVRGGVSSSFSWSPDSKQLIYAKKDKIDAHGSHYYDLYTYNLTEKKEKRLTTSKRLHSPDWSATDDKIVCLNNYDGTNNIFIYDLKTSALTQLTQFKEGEQIFQPRWSHNGKVIVYGISTANTRDIAMISADGKTQTKIIADEFDARNPVFSANDQEIIFSYDKTGIYNLYTYHLKSGRLKQLTNVIGGAFMPSANGRDQIVYAQFDGGKYKLAYLKSPQQIDPQMTQYLDSTENFHYFEPEEPAKTFQVASVADGAYNDSDVPDYEIKPYKNIYSKVSFLPRVMLDYKSNNAIRVGTYLMSSDVLNRYSIFGGVSVNRQFEYDVFGSFEYRRFRPTLFFEIYSSRLRTESLQNFTIDMSLVEYFYQFIEMDAGARYKLNDANGIDLRYVYTRYRASQEYELNDQLNKFAYNYYLSNVASITWDFDGLMPYLDSDIQPIGRKISLNFEYELSKFIKGFKISKYSTYVPDFDRYHFSRVTLDWQEYRGLFKNRHSIGFHFQGGLIEKPVNSFLNFFGGGLLYLRGYPFYSIEGRKLLLTRFKYSLPLLRNLDWQLFHIYFDKLYGHVFYDYGNAFDQNKLKEVDFKRDVGLELRLNMVSFYSYPAYFFASAAYGLDKFTHENVLYGKEWRYYFGVSFGYFE